MTRTSDTRITGYEPLLSPSALLDQLPLDDEAAAIVEQSRAEVRAVLDGSDDRLLVIAGPCSVHDPAAALDYAGQLIGARELHRADLLIVMRVYFEKPRTVTGWKGLINDPGMDGGHDVHRGLHTARQLLRDIVAHRPAGGLRMARPDHAAVHRGHGDLGRDRRADHREPGPPPARLRPVHAGRVQERHRRRRPGGGGRVPGLGRRAHVLRRHPQRRRRGGDHGGQRGHARDPARRPLRAELRGQPHRQGPGPDRRGRAAAPPDGGRQPRQQRQGPPAPAGGRRRHRRAGGGRRARPDRGDAGELPGRGQAGTRPPARPHLRAERHRRVHGLRHHRRRAGRAGRRVRTRRRAAG